MAPPTFVPPLGASACPAVTASTFTPGGSQLLRRATTARDPLRVCMGAAAAAFHPTSSSSAAAAAALRAAGGVNPHTHHVAAVLYRAAAAGTRRAPPSSPNSTLPPPVAYATAAGGGVVGGDAAVAADAAAKGQAWAATMAALRTAGVADLGSLSRDATRADSVHGSRATAAAASASSRPVSVTVAGAPRVAVSAYTTRMARLGDHAAKVSASMAAQAAAVESEGPTVEARPSMGAALLAAVSGVAQRSVPKAVPAPAPAKVTPPPPVDGARVAPSPSAAASLPVDQVPAVQPSRPSSVAPSNLTSVGAWPFSSATTPTTLAMATATAGSGSAASSAVSTPLPSTVAALVAAKSPEEPSVEEAVEDTEADIPDAMRAVLPPVLTAAFVGACLALSHVGAVIGAGMTPM